MSRKFAIVTIAALLLGLIGLGVPLALVGYAVATDCSYDKLDQYKAPEFVAELWRANCNATVAHHYWLTATSAPLKAFDRKATVFNGRSEPYRITVSDGSIDIGASEGTVTQTEIQIGGSDIRVTSGQTQFPN